MTALFHEILEGIMMAGISSPFGRPFKGPFADIQGDVVSVSNPQERSNRGLSHGTKNGDTEKERFTSKTRARTSRVPSDRFDVYISTGNLSLLPLPLLDRLCISETPTSVVHIDKRRTDGDGSRGFPAQCQLTSFSNVGLK